MSYDPAAQLFCLKWLVFLRKRQANFAAALPLLACAGSFALWLTFTVRNFVSLKHLASGAQIATIGGSSTIIEIPANAFPKFALISAAIKSEVPITILNAPSHFVELIIAYVIARTPFWFPDALGPAVWHCIVYPLFAIPAWFFVGRGIDTLLGRRRASRIDIIMSLVLVVLFGGFASVLVFALADDPGLVRGYMAGFTLWTILFAIPAIAGFRQRFAKASL